MAEYSKDEALAFIEAMRLTLAGKVGFKWMTEKLADLYAHIESIHAENEHLNAFIDHANARDDYESYRATHPDAEGPGDAPAGEKG